MSKEHAYAYEAGYRDGSINYELEHCPACKNVADLQEALADNDRLREERDYHKALWEHATVTDCELRRVRAALKEERKQNAKLRESLEYANNEWEKDSIEFLNLQAENAKLRELVKSMYYDLTHMTFPPDWVTDYKADMRELGVDTGDAID